MPRPEEGVPTVHENRPSWQIDECPPWCAGGHGENDHPDDRVHRSGAPALPVVARRTWFEGAGIRRCGEAAEFEVGLSRVDGERDTWLYLGDGPGRSLEISVESAQRLVRRAAVVLDGSG